MTAAIDRAPVTAPPFATYNLHPFGGSPHARDEGYRELLAQAVEQAGMLCKCGVAWSRPPTQPCSETVSERSGRNTVHTTVYHTPRGDLRSVVVKPDDQPPYQTEALVKTAEDVERYLALPWAPGEPDPAPVRALLAELAGRGLAYVAYPDPFYSASRLFDFEDFTVRCLTEQALIRRLVDALMERCREEVRRLAAAVPTDGVLFYTAGPEIATPPMLSPEVFANFVVPYHRELVRILHDAGHRVALHCHGRVREVFDSAVACGFDAIEPLEPPPQGDITLPELIARADGRIALMGYVQDQEFHLAEPGHFSRVVDTIAGWLGDRTGYVMTPTCTPFQHPPTATFVRNYSEWLTAAARRFGG